MCLVETGTKDKETGKITMMPKVVPGCQTPAKDGTVFVTNSDKVKASRAMVEEDLLIDHPIDCPICDKAGECLLQDYHFEHGQEERRADIRPFTSRKRDVGETVTLFVDRCIMCTRCVRFTREITGTAELMVANRGSHEEIDVFEGYPLDNKLSGNVVDLCPVGALGDRDFLYKQRVWFMKKHNGVCAGCATGCSITIDENQDAVFRLKPRENPHINKWWMCDEGRYNYNDIHRADRLNGPKRRKGAGYNPQDMDNIEWSMSLRCWPRIFATPLTAKTLAKGAGSRSSCRHFKPSKKRTCSVNSHGKSIPKRSSRWANPNRGERRNIPRRIYDPRRKVPEPPRRRTSARSLWPARHLG